MFTIVTTFRLQRPDGQTMDYTPETTRVQLSHARQAAAESLVQARRDARAAGMRLTVAGVMIAEGDRRTGAVRHIWILTPAEAR